MQWRMATNSFYDILEVSPQASPSVIRAAYRCLAQRHHPDKNLHSEEAGPLLATINLAYAVLSDPEKRRSYDAHLGRPAEFTERRGPGAAPSTHASLHRAEATPSRPFVFRPLM